MGAAAPTGGGGGNRGVLIGAIVGVVAILGVIGFLVLGGGGDDTATGDPGDETGEQVTTTVADEPDDEPDEATTTTAEATTTTAAPPDDGIMQVDVDRVVESFVTEGNAADLMAVVSAGVATVTGTPFDEDIQAEVVAALEAVDGISSVVDNQEPLAEEFRCGEDVKNKERWVCITEATFDGTNINLVFDAADTVAWNTSGGFHFHVFAGTIEPTAAGVNNGVSDGSGSWALTDQLEFSTTPGAIGGNADIESVCIRVATDGHGIDSLTSGNCWPVERPEG